MTALLADKTTGDSALHDNAVALAKDGKSNLLESSLIVCRSGQKASVESIREGIHPTKFEPPGLPCDFRKYHGEPSNFHPSEQSATAFEARNTGLTLKVEATIISPNQIDLQLAQEMVVNLGIQTWLEYADQRGEADIRFPLYETRRTHTRVILTPGKFALIAVITPRRQLSVPLVNTRILLFVRADLVGTVLAE